MGCVRNLDESWRQRIFRRSQESREIDHYVLLINTCVNISEHIGINLKVILYKTLNHTLDPEDGKVTEKYHSILLLSLL